MAAQSMSTINILLVRVGSTFYSYNEFKEMILKNPIVPYSLNIPFIQEIKNLSVEFNKCYFSACIDVVRELTELRFSLPKKGKEVIVTTKYLADSDSDIFIIGVDNGSYLSCYHIIVDSSTMIERKTLIV